jgi:hypothetical protein
MKHDRGRRTYTPPKVFNPKRKIHDHHYDVIASVGISVGLTVVIFLFAARFETVIHGSRWRPPYDIIH